MKYYEMKKGIEYICKQNGLRYRVSDKWCIEYFKPTSRNWVKTSCGSLNLEPFDFQEITPKIEVTDNQNKKYLVEKDCLEPLKEWKWVEVDFMEAIEFRYNEEGKIRCIHHTGGARAIYVFTVKPNKYKENIWDLVSEEGTTLQACMILNMDWYIWKEV